jgi:arylsulfatase
MKITSFSLTFFLALGFCSSLLALSLPEVDPVFNGVIGKTISDSKPDYPKPVQAPEGAPNIIVVLIDDAGYGATSTFGGLIRTPALDKLASEGLRYNQFHVSAQCSPTRAALLTGRNDHVAGFGAVGFGGYPGYDGVLKKSTALFADVLRRNGYSTAAFGKWHNTPSWEVTPVGPFDRWPTSVGFEYFYGFMNGQSDQYDPILYRNTTAVNIQNKHNSSYYLTRDLTSDAIAWIQTHDSLAPERPYFLYFATGATHEPLQVADKWIQKYKGKFDQGWDKLREQIFENQKRLGVIPSSAELTPRPKEMPSWDSYSQDMKKVLAHQMEVYAGFLEQTDFELGRLIEASHKTSTGKNTLIFYIAGDNGASSEGGLEGSDDFHTRRQIPETVEERLIHMNELGSPLHENHYASGWAWALCTPFKWQKLIASHFGGTRDPLIVSWPAGISDRGSVRTQFTHVNDIAATIYSITGIQPPDYVDGIKQLPLNGVSFAQSFKQANSASEHHIQIFEQWGNRSIYNDGWIAAARHTIPWSTGIRVNDGGYDQDTWELYNITSDYSEAHDLASVNPAKLEELKGLFESEAIKNNIYPMGGATARADMPVFIGDKKHFVYHASLPRMQPMAAPKFEASHRITARVRVPDKGVSGVLVSDGSRSGGFVLYVKDNRLVYENNTTFSHELIVSSQEIPKGEVELAFEFTRTAKPSEGLAKLYINSHIVAEKHIARLGFDTSGGYKMVGSFGVGQSYASSVSTSFESPNKFTGLLHELDIDLK